MRIGLASDHAGFELKMFLKDALSVRYDIIDYGVDKPETSDYPDIARVFAEGFLRGEFERGIIICGSGIGVSLTVNKYPGIRAALAGDCYTARMGRLHNDINVLVLGGRIVASEYALEIVKEFLQTPFSGEERHTRRLRKLATLESENFKFISVPHFSRTSHPFFQLIRTESFQSRFFRPDAEIWNASKHEEVANRIGWIRQPLQTGEILARLESIHNELANDFTHVVLLGMGGSSLAPRVFHRTFPETKNPLTFLACDTTHPDVLESMIARLPIESTHFIVASKSGTTLETLSLFHFFFEKVKAIRKDPGQAFSAITDANSPLEHIAREHDFYHVWLPQPDIGGRYSAFTEFGLVPVGYAGTNFSSLEESLKTIQEWIQHSSFPPALIDRLDMLFEKYNTGKVSTGFILPSELIVFGEWLKQLIAESLGKDSRGILPFTLTNFIPHDGPWGIFCYDDHRISSVPYVCHGHRHLTSPGDISEEMYIWMCVVALSALWLRVHPFNQPDVQLAKSMTKTYLKNGLHHQEAMTHREPVDVCKAFEHWFSQRPFGGYLAFLVYGNLNSSVWGDIESLKTKLIETFRIPVLIEQGPGYLHSTGQYFKGGPLSGFFIGVFEEPQTDFSIPHSEWSFAQIVKAQAYGDFEALRQRGHPIHVFTTQDAASFLHELLETFLALS